MDDLKRRRDIIKDFSNLPLNCVIYTSLDWTEHVDGGNAVLLSSQVLDFEV
jgi:hypothetical protein